MTTVAASQLTKPSQTSKRADRYRRRDQARLRGVQPIERVQGCGKAIATRVALGMALDGAHAAGVATCGSVWSCPVCSPVIRQSRAADLERAIERWQASGGECFFVTLTLPHHRGNSLASTITALMDSWRSINSGDARRSIDAELSVLGTVRSFDTTWGDSHGWHPHFHCVWFVRTRSTKAVRRSIVDRWVDFSGTRSGRQAVRAACDVQRISRGKASTFSTAMYAMKAGLELMRLDLKAGGSGASPWQLLGSAIEGERKAADLWSEYATTMHGRHACHWSQRLRAWFGEPDASDDERAAGSLDGFVPIGFVSSRQWNSLRRRPGAHARLLEAVELGRLDAVAFDLGIDIEPPD